MARPVSKTLTEGELRIMRVLWHRGPSSAQEIADNLRKPRVARSSVMTILAVLERKGYVRHDQQDRTYVFSAVLDVKGARRSAVQTLLSNFFGGSVDALVASLIETDLTVEDVHAVRTMIEQADGRLKPRSKRK
jgi:predicted transcriptional regulator